MKQPRVLEALVNTASSLGVVRIDLAKDYIWRNYPCACVIDKDDLVPKDPWYGRGRTRLAAAGRSNLDQSSNLHGTKLGNEKCRGVRGLFIQTASSQCNDYRDIITWPPVLMEMYRRVRDWSSTGEKFHYCLVQALIQLISNNEDRKELSLVSTARPKKRVLVATEA